MDIHHVNALPPLVLQKLVLHLPNLVIDPLITRFDILQLVRCDSDIFPSDDTSGTCRRFVGVVKYSTLASGELGGCVEDRFDVLRRNEIPAVRCRPKIRQT
jgi:hypothetical protein